jgi:hypothetical protein
MAGTAGDPLLPAARWMTGRALLCWQSGHLALEAERA